MPPRRALRPMLAAVVLAVAAAGVGLAQEEPPVTIRAGLLIDGTGDTRSNARLFVNGSEITRVDGLRGSVDYDLSELTVMPGLIDTHVHLTSHFEADGRLHQAGSTETPAQTMLHAVGNAYRTLMAGFTTVQSLGHPLDADLRDAIDRGDVPGPRVLTSLRAVTSATGDADAIRATAFTAVILVVVSLVGAGMEAGPLGYVVILALAGLFGAAYSGIGATIALRTGNAQAAQAGFLVFFPLLFLSPAFAPKEVFDPWMEFLASLNPVTYLLEGMRALVLEGWEWDNLAGAVAAVAGLGVVTIALSLWSLGARTR